MDSQDTPLRDLGDGSLATESLMLTVRLERWDIGHEADRVIHESRFGNGRVSFESLDALEGILERNGVKTACGQARANCGVLSECCRARIAPGNLSSRPSGHSPVACNEAP